MLNSVHQFGSPVSLLLHSVFCPLLPLSIVFSPIHVSCLLPYLLPHFSFFSIIFALCSCPGEGELAAAHYQQAVRLKPAHYVAMVNLGRLLRSSNENKEAESWYKR